MKLTSDIVAIIPLRRAQRTKSGLILPGNPPPLVWGEVIEIGPGHRGERSKTLWPTFMQTGDRVLYPEGAVRGAYSNIDIDGIQYDNLVFVHERDCDVVIRDGEMLPLYRKIIGHILPEEAEVFTGTLWIPTAIAEEKKDPKNYCRVHVDAVGFGQRSDTAELIPLTVKAGDTVIITRWDAWEFDLMDGDADQGHVTIDEDQILAIEGFDD